MQNGTSFNPCLSNTSFRPLRCTIWLAFFALGATTLLQIGIVALSGSVALLADTVHNVGDTLNSISRKFSATLSDLLRWNNLNSASVIHPGDRVWVGDPAPAGAPQGVSERGATSPGAGTAVASAAAPTAAPVAAPPSTVTYKVRKGDTLHSIARLYDVTVSQVMSWNGISEAGVIVPGQVLRIHR